MAELRAIHDNLDDLPESIDPRELYTEKDGKFELTGISGIKTDADVQRVRVTLEKERTNHLETKQTLNLWGDLNHDDVQAQLDRIPELEAASKGKLDEAQIEEIVERRLQGTIKSKMSPLERKVRDLTKERDEFSGENVTLRGDARKTKIHSAVQKALVKAKVESWAYADALRLADDTFEIREDDGKVVTRENGSSMAAGLAPADWLTELQPERPGWWPASVGGRSRGTGGVGAGGKNPWSHENWNVTEQMLFHREHGADRATSMAKAAGTEIGKARPAKK